MNRLRNRVPHLMRLALQVHGAEWQRQVPDLTKPQYSVLEVVAAEPGIEQSAAGVAAGSDRSTLAAMLMRLEDRGLLRRRVDPGDRRRRLLYLTEHGREAVEDASPVVHEVDDALLAPLTRKEREQLSALLMKLVEG